MPWAARLLVLQSANSARGSWHACRKLALGIYLVVFPGIALGICSFFMREPPRDKQTKETQSRIVRWRDYSFCSALPLTCCAVWHDGDDFRHRGIAFWMPYYLNTSRRQRSGGSHFRRRSVRGGAAGNGVGGMAGDKLRPRLSGSYLSCQAWRCCSDSPS